MKKYTAYITIQGNKEAKGVKMKIYAENDSEAISKAWQCISVKVENLHDEGKRLFDMIFK